MTWKPSKVKELSSGMGPHAVGLRMSLEGLLQIKAKNIKMRGPMEHSQKKHARPRSSGAALGEAGCGQLNVRSLEPESKAASRVRLGCGKGKGLAA